MHVAAGRPVARSARIVSEQLALAAAFVALAVVLFAAAMTAALDYDEEQYIAGAYFARELALYSDFISFQPPPYTWIVSMVFDRVGGWYLLSARVVTWAFAFGSCLLLFSLLLSYGTGRVVALALVVGFATSPFTEGPLVETRNDIMPLFWLLVGLRLFVGPGSETSGSATRMLASGFFFSLAAATKYSYVFAAPIGVAVLLYQDWVRRGGALAFRMPRIGAFVVGAGVGILPLAYALVIHQDRFVFLTFEFFRQTASYDFYRSQGQGELLTWSYKLMSLPRQMVRNGNLTILLIFALSAIALARSVPWDRWLRPGRAPSTVVVAGLFCGSLVVSTYVGPHAMYYAPVAALGALLAGRVYAAARRGIPRWLTAAVLIIALLPATPAFQRYGNLLVRSASLDQWTGVRAHRSALGISRILAEHGVSGHVATLFPIVAIDANRILPEFAAGPFFFRVADSYPAERVARLHGVGPATLESLFAASPPAAIVAGFGPFRRFNRMDAALIDYARRSGFVLVAENWTVGRYRNGQVWLRPAP